MATPKRRKVEIEDLFRLRVITGADISPDGELIVFAVRRIDPGKNRNFSSLYAIPARGGRMRRLTRGDLPERLGQIDEQHRLFLAAVAAAPAGRR